MNEFGINQGTGFAIVMAVVLLAVIIYTVIKLNQQVRKAGDAEKKKTSGNNVTQTGTSDTSKGNN